MNEQRKTVYKLRQQLLLGIYKPETLDEDGKPTGKMRDIKVNSRIADEVKRAVVDMVAAPRHADRFERRKQAAAEDGRGGRRDLLDGLAAAGHLPVLGLPLRLQGRRRQEADRGPRSPAPRHPAEPDRAARTAPRSRRQHRRRDRRGVLPREQAARGLGLEGHQGRIRRALRGKGRPKSSTCTTPSRSRRLLFESAEKKLDEKEKETGTELLLRVFRHFYLEEIDRQWVDHLTNMEHLRDGIGLRGYGQRDPKQEYKKEGYDVFMTMMAATSSNVCSKLFKVQVQAREGDRANRARGRGEARRSAARDADAPWLGARCRRRRRAGAPTVGAPSAPAGPRAASRPARGAEDRP